jgi:multisubunit Na+/H+ antiporter MnhG subunit
VGIAQENGLAIIPAILFLIGALVSRLGWIAVARFPAPIWNLFSPRNAPSRSRWLRFCFLTTSL